MPGFLEGFLKRFDPLLVGIFASMVIAFIVPASGSFAVGFAVAVKLAIALLFFLYGARLSTHEAMKGLTNWRLHLLILAFTFLIYPVIGVLLRQTTAFLSQEIYQGILFAMLVPSTVQSSVALTGIARGNVSGAVVAASVSSLVGVVATPVLVMLLMGTGTGVRIDATVFTNIALQLLLPFVLGQLAHNYVPRAKEIAKSKATKIVDRGSIWMVVYSAFSSGVVSGVWSNVKLWEIVFLIVFAVVLVVAMLWLSKVVPQALGFNREDRVAVQMCGTQKSLATGLPMATVIFGGAQLGVLIVPLMIYHMIQIVTCSAYASRLHAETA